MKKIAFGSGEIIVSLTPTEFNGLAGKSHSGVADGTNVSLVSIKQKIDLVDSKSAELTEVKKTCLELAAKISDIGI